MDFGKLYKDYKKKSKLAKVFDPVKLQRRMGIRPLSVYIIALLHKKDMHGYEIMKSIETQTKIFGMSEMKVSYGQLYPLLHKMEKVKIIKGKKVGKRKVYSLTKDGKQAYKEAKELSLFMMEIQKYYYNLMFG